MYEFKVINTYLDETEQEFEDMLNSYGDEGWWIAAVDAGRFYLCRYKNTWNFSFQSSYDKPLSQIMYNASNN